MSRNKRPVCWSGAQDTGVHRRGHKVTEFHEHCMDDGLLSVMLRHGQKPTFGLHEFSIFLPNESALLTAWLKPQSQMCVWGQVGEARHESNPPKYKLRKMCN